MKSSTSSVSTVRSQRTFRFVEQIRLRLIEMSTAKPVKCQKCGKPIGYVTLLAKGLTSLQQPIQNVKIVAICMDCSKNRR